jgi:hypothetical protein
MVSELSVFENFTGKHTKRLLGFTRPYMAQNLRSSGRGEATDFGGEADVLSAIWPKCLLSGVERTSFGSGQRGDF